MMISRILILGLTFFLVHCAHGLRTNPISWDESYSNTVSCSGLTKQKRYEILDLADPDNFPRTRYRKGPRNRRKIERETDCSSFVHEIYRRAGLPYRFRTTKELKAAPEFMTVPPSKAKPGDIVLFRGHVGILAKSGKIISSTKIRSKRQPSSITEYPDNSFGRVKAVLRYRCDNANYAALNKVTRPNRNSMAQSR